MHIFRLFGVAVLIPLISVGLCAQDSPGKSNINKSGLKQDKARHLSSSPQIVNSTANSAVSFPAVNTIAENATSVGPDSISPRQSLPIHPHPLHLDVHISNSTRIDHLNPTEGEGRGLILDFLNLSWIFTLLWKAISSYAIVAIVNLMLTPFIKKFGYGGPYWETSINLGNEGDQHLFNFGPSLKKLRVSFGGNKGSSKDDMKKEESNNNNNKNNGWGPPMHGGGMHGHQQPGHIGFNPNHVGPGWLSYDQAAFGIPSMDKYSMKAAKKAQKYTKKAQKFAHKASKYAAKAQAAKLAIKPLYANGFIHPGAATVPGIPAYGWGR